MAESFFSSLEKERIRKRNNKTRDLAQTDVFNYIGMLYKRPQRRCHLNGVSTEAFERPRHKDGICLLSRGQSNWSYIP
ncbi:TPA: IS3 family transposase [Klebsiella oxytoca]|uniref:IS3 family transposase n=2 Tax=Klebsiella TaxID=570 RepID=A0A839CDS6_9ENTR|nr:IS3 family transposase [Klebsiella grimontii]MBK4366923.1 IS3 family transposase [Enterobacter hormaechei]PLM66117.1 hypothetical protein CWM85_09445 [Klebsiella michiganensis]BAS38568.1 ISEc14 transposase B [Klebsiella oxytoca]HCB1482098.1 IS3 family transposase [Serratia marcescens]